MTQRKYFQTQLKFIATLDSGRGTSYIIFKYYTGVSEIVICHVPGGL